MPDWRRRWLLSPWPWLAALIAVMYSLPVLIWNAGHDWASFRFQFVRAVATHPLSFRTVGEFIGLQFGLVGFVLLPVVLSGVTLTAWRGYRTREPVAILLSTAVLVPFLYFLWKSLTLPCRRHLAVFLWPAGFAATAINLVLLPREGWPDWIVKSSFWWARVAVISGIAFVVGVFFYYVAAPWNLIGRTDPVGGEAGYEQVAARAREQLQATGATWIATSDYRTYAMMRWHFNGQVPVIQINERGRFQGFGDPGMSRDQGSSRPLRRARAGQPPAAVGPHHRQAPAAGAGRARLARRGDGYLRAGKTRRAGRPNRAAAGFAAVPLARTGGGEAGTDRELRSPDERSDIRDDVRVVPDVAALIRATGCNIKCHTASILAP